MRYKNVMSVAIAVCVLGAMAASADPVKLRVGWVAANADAPLLMFGRKGISKHEGVSYTLEAIHFQGSPPMITALATGDVDLVGFGFSTLPIAVQNAGMSDLRIVADLFQDGVEGHYTNEFSVLKDGPIHTVEDLKGKIAATNAAGSAVDMVLRAMLRKHGLDEKRDVTIIEAGFPNMPAMLSEHKVDLIAALRNFTADPKFLAYARPLFTQRDAIGRSQMAFLAGRTGFLEKNRAAVIDYLEDELRELHWYNDPANHDEAVKIMADYNKVPVSLITSWMFTKDGDFYHDPDGLPDLDALQSNIELQRQLGFVKSELDVKPLADLSYVKEAAARAR